MIPAHPAETRPRLVLLNTGFQGRQYILEGVATRIGRSRECEIHLDLESISRRHAVIEEKGGCFFVRDLGSRNGIRLGNQQVAHAELHDGDVIAVGQALLRFQCAAGASAAGAALSAESSARPLTAADLVAASSGSPTAGLATDEPAAADAAGATVGLNIKLVSAIIAALVLSLGVGALILWGKNLTTTSRTLKLGHVLIQAGENKWMSWDRKFGDFTYEDIRSEDETVADASRYGPHELLIRGRAGGSTTIEVTTDKGRHLSVRVLVRGRLHDPLEELTYARFSSDAERRARAQRFLERGMRLEAKAPYLALQEYRKAEAVLKPIQENERLFDDAQVHIRNTEAVIETRWEELSTDIRMSLKNKAQTQTYNLIEEALELIPDNNDPRHQKVAWLKERLKNEALEIKAKRKKGRGR